MKATVDAKEFAEALKKLSGVLKKSAIPILENIRVEFSGDQCLLTATNLNIWMTARLPARGDAFAFVFKNTVNATRACRYYSGELELELTGEMKNLRLTMYCAGKGGEFPADTAEDYPVLPVEEAAQRYKVNAKEVFQRVRRVQYASAVSTSRPVYEGIRFQDDRVWCTDGFRVAVSSDEKLRVEKPFVVERNALRHLRALEDMEMEIAVGRRYAVFSAGAYAIYTRLMEEARPLNLDVAWPKELNEQYMVGRESYLDAINYLSEFAGKTRVAAVFNKGVISLRGSDFSFSAEIPVDGQCDIPYGFDLKYMKEALEQFPGSDTIQIGVNGPLAPIVLNGEVGEAALVFPVRVKEDLLSKAA